MLTVLAAVVVAVLGATVAAAWTFERRIPPLRANGDGSEGRPPRVSVIIPARDEEALIGRCVEACLAQTEVDLDVVVVDDQSSDGTAEEARRAAADDPRLLVVPGRPLPEGWFGKQNAAAHGATFARGDWLAFVDADTTLLPGALRAAVDTAERERATFVSCWPEQRAPGFWDGRVQPWVVGLAAVGDAFRRLWSPAWPVALSAWGQLIVVEADAYRRTGGHDMVAEKNLEDSEFALAMRRAGERAVCFDGREHVSVRMYAGREAVIRGWGKNLYVGLGGHPLPALAVALYVVIVAIGGPLLFVSALLARSVPVLVLALVAILLQAVLGRLFAERVAVTPRRRWSAASPLGGATYVAILLASMVRSERGLPVRWKGRSYP